MAVVIHHNPDCGTSRNVLALIVASGTTPTIIRYRETGWTRPQLLGLFAAGGLTPHSALRVAGTAPEALGLTRPDITGDDILDAMVAHPILVNRPIVCSPKGVKLCRPSEAVLDLLDRLPPGPFLKEDGTVIIDAEGVRRL